MLKKVAAQRVDILVTKTSPVRKKSRSSTIATAAFHSHRDLAQLLPVNTFLAVARFHILGIETGDSQVHAPLLGNAKLFDLAPTPSVPILNLSSDFGRRTGIATSPAKLNAFSTPHALTAEPMTVSTPKRIRSWLFVSATFFLGGCGSNTGVLPPDERPVMTDAEEKEYERQTMGSSLNDSAQN